MFRAAQIAATGMSAQQTNVEVISNNVANLNTTGYKANIADFQDLLYQNLNRGAGVQSTVGGNIPPYNSQIGLGVKTVGVLRNLEQGPLLQTRNTFDVAIQGRGHFQVTDAEGNIFFTRSGRLSINNQGILVNAQGFVIEPAITIPDNATEITINPQGEVFALIPGNLQPQNLGRLALVSFMNEGGLKSIGNNLLQESFASGTPLLGNPGLNGLGTLEQGFVENSNVDAVREITTLIQAQRAYELNSRIISATDEMLSNINNIR